MRSGVAQVAYLALVGASAACSPVQPGTGPSGRSAPVSLPAPVASTPPPSWQRVSFVSGLSVTVPPTAKVAYPQGADSYVMEISGEGFQLTFDDYGPFNGNGEFRLAGRPAEETTQAKGNCRLRVVRIELPKPWPLMSCPPADKQCRAPNGKVALSSLCKGATACGTVDAIIGSATLNPEPHPPFPRPDRDWRPPEQPLCSVE